MIICEDIQLKLFLYFFSFSPLWIYFTYRGKTGQAAGQRAERMDQANILRKFIQGVCVMREGDQKGEDNFGSDFMVRPARHPSPSLEHTRAVLTGFSALTDKQVMCRLFSFNTMDSRVFSRQCLCLRQFFLFLVMLLLGFSRVNAPCWAACYAILGAEGHISPAIPSYKSPGL